MDRRRSDRYAVWLSGSECTDILKTAHKINYARIDAKELPNLLRKLDVYPGRHSTRLAIKLMALTFVRTS
jgi:hypothetical protein